MRRLRDLDLRLLLTTQRTLQSPAVIRASESLARAGDDARAWLAVAVAGAALGERNRQRWALAGSAVFVSHATSVILKHVTRRPRPHDPRVIVRAGTPTGWGMPSSHATSTTTAAMTFTADTGTPIWWVLVPAMATARLIKGAHYPSDVVAGAALGVAMGWPFLRRINTTEY